MKKLFFIFYSLTIANIGFSQNQLAEDYINSSNKTYELIKQQVSPSEVNNFLTDLESVKNEGDYYATTSKYMSNQSAIELKEDIATVIKSAITLGKSVNNKDELSVILKENIDPPTFPCINRNAYDKCISGVMKEYDEEMENLVWDVLVFAGTAVGTEGTSLIIGWANALNIARKMHNNSSKRDAGIGDCYNVHCKGDGGGIRSEEGPGAPSGGLKTNEENK